MAMTQMVKRGLVAAGVAAVLATVPLVALAQDGHGPWHGRRGFMGDGFAGLRQLGLTDDQHQQIRAAMTSHRDEFKAIADRVRKAREAQQAAIEQVPLNEPQIRAASSELAAAEADAAVLRARVHEQVFSLLTPDQQAKAKSLAAERKQFRAQRRAEWQQRMEQLRKQQPSQAAPQQQ
jgi:Spy/CpxP family protein refolding chaperone